MLLFTFDKYNLNYEFPLSADTGAVGGAAGRELDALGPLSRARGTAWELAVSSTAGDGDGGGSHGREGIRQVHTQQAWCCEGAAAGTADG